MDSGLKERLVGAAVLVALGVWLIPWILDGQDAAPEATDTYADQMELPAAAADGPARTQTHTISLADDAAPDEPAAGTAAPEAEPEAAAAAAAADSAPANTIGTGSPARDRATAAAQSGGQAATAVVTGPLAEGSTEASTEASATGSAEAATPAAAPAPALAAAEGWYVQLGSFGDADNARRLAGRVATFGYKAEVSPYRAGGRTLNRVRVGPRPTRDEASVVASSLAAHGFVAQVVGAD